MIIPWILLILSAPLAGWLIGRFLPLSRPGATPEDRKRDIIRNVIPALLWLPCIFLGYSGVGRWALLTATGLLYAAMIVSAKRRQA